MNDTPSPKRRLKDRIIYKQVILNNKILIIALYKSYIVRTKLAQL